MAKPFETRVVVITAACGVLGRACAQAFARAGANLVLAARDEAGLRALEDLCIELGGTAMAIPADLTQAADVEQLAEEALAQFGRIDVWVNPGEAEPSLADDDPGAAARLAALRAEPVSSAWQRTFDDHVHGCANASRAALRRFRIQRRGVLINHTLTFPSPTPLESSAIAVASAAVRALSRGLRDEWRREPGIRVCLLLSLASESGAAGADAPWAQGADAREFAEAVLRLARWPRGERVIRHPRSAARDAPGPLERAARQSPPGADRAGEEREGERRAGEGRAGEGRAGIARTGEALAEATRPGESLRREPLVRIAPVRDPVAPAAAHAAPDALPGRAEGAASGQRPILAAVAVGLVLAWTALRRRLRGNGPP